MHPAHDAQDELVAQVLEPILGRCELRPFIEADAAAKAQISAADANVELIQGCLRVRAAGSRAATGEIVSR